MAKAKNDEKYPHIISGFRIGIHNWTLAGSSAGKLGELKKGISTQSPREKVHLNTTPLDLSGSGYPGYDALIGDLVKEDGHSPCIEYRVYFDGKLVSDTDALADTFEIGSYEGDGGCTPAMAQKEPVGPGRVRIEIQPFISGDYNGGVDVDGPRVGWYAD